MSKMYKYILLETEVVYDNYDDYHEVIRLAFRDHCKENVIEIPSEENNMFVYFAKSKNLLAVRLLGNEETVDIMKMYEEYRDNEYKKEQERKVKAEEKNRKRQATIEKNRLKKEQEEVEAAKKLLKDKGLLP